MDSGRKGRTKTSGDPHRTTKRGVEETVERGTHTRRRKTTARDRSARGFPENDEDGGGGDAWRSSKVVSKACDQLVVHEKCFAHSKFFGKEMVVLDFIITSQPANYPLV